IPKQGVFRRTISITFITSPVKIDKDNQNISFHGKYTFLDDLFCIKDELLSQITDPFIDSSSSNIYHVYGPLKKAMHLADECSIKDILKTVSIGVMRKMLNEKNCKDDTIESL